MEIQQVKFFGGLTGIVLVLGKGLAGYLNSDIQDENYRFQILVSSIIAASAIVYNMK
jgi:hypothetical protein